MSGDTEQLGIDDYYDTYRKPDSETQRLIDKEVEAALERLRKLKNNGT